MAALFRRRNRPTWYLNFWQAGKHVVRSCKTTDYAQALKLKAEEEAHHETPSRPGIQWGKIGLDKAPRSRETIRKRFEVLVKYAYCILAPEPERFKFLLEPPKVTLLFYLGRIGNPEDTKRVAAALCQGKFTVARGRPFIYRMMKRSRAAPPLAKVIARAVDQWAQLYPEQFLKTSLPDVLEGLAIDVRDAERRQQIAA
jgi:hypothetical protein